jgi:hypothetical protein
MRARVVPERPHQRMPLERRLHYPSLNPSSPAVNDPYACQPGGGGLSNILVDDRHDVPGQEAVKIQFVAERNDVRVVGV